MRQLTWVSLALFFFISACTKIESTDIGSGLIPPVDGVITLDTILEVDTKNFFDPNALTEKVYKSDDHVIGVINNDPLFGSTSATAYFELKPLNFPYALSGDKASITADSVVLILSYKGAYGDQTMNQRWEVREISEVMRHDTTYNISQSFNTSNILTPLGGKEIDITKLKDTITNRFEAASNQIRIKLTTDFAKRLIEQYDSDGAYHQDSVFEADYFKGFAVSPAAGSAGNALIRINLLDSNTKLGLYYNYTKTDGTRDTTVSYFRFSSGASSTNRVSASANFIKRDYTSSILSQTVGMAKPTDTMVYIQTSPGTFATIKIPGLSSFQNAIIHRAELLMYQVPNDAALNTLLPPPQYLLLSAFDPGTNVKKNIPNDFIFSTTGGTAIISYTSANLGSFGGFVLQRSVPGYGILNNYTFDISRYVQGIITRKDPNYTLRLSAPANDSLSYTPPYPANTTTTTCYTVPSTTNTTAFGRVCLGGTMDTSNPVRMRLRIIYSKI